MQRHSPNTHLHLVGYTCCMSDFVHYQGTCTHIHDAIVYICAVHALCWLLMHASLLMLPPSLPAPPQKRTGGDAHA